MKIGKLYIGRHVDRAVRDCLRGPDGRELVARMARSEVKNILAEVAEAVEMPYLSPEHFMRDLRLQLDKWTLEMRHATTMERRRYTSGCWCTHDLEQGHQWNDQGRKACTAEGCHCILLYVKKPLNPDGKPVRP